MNEIVDIKTGKPILNARQEAAKKRETLIRYGKQWAKLIERIEAGEINLTVKVVGQELDFNETIIPYLDSLIEEQDIADKATKRKNKYAKTKQ